MFAPITFADSLYPIKESLQCNFNNSTKFLPKSSPNKNDCCDERLK